MRAHVLAFTLATSLASSRPCVAQQTATDGAASPPRTDSSRAIGREDPRVALLLGVISPGAGHRYAGERGRGLLLSVGATTPIFYGLLHDLAVELEGFGRKARLGAVRPFVGRVAGGVGVGASISFR